MDSGVPEGLTNKYELSLTGNHQHPCTQTTTTNNMSKPLPNHKARTILTKKCAFRYQNFTHCDINACCLSTGLESILKILYFKAEFKYRYCVYCCSNYKL